MMPDEATIEAAFRLLSGMLEYRWLTGTDHQWFTVADVSAHMGISDDAVRAAAKRGDIPGAVLYASQVGWRLPRSGLAVYFAGLYGRQQQQGQHAG